MMREIYAVFRSEQVFSGIWESFEFDFDKKIKKKQYLGLTERSLCGIL